MTPKDGRWRFKDANAQPTAAGVLIGWHIHNGCMITTAEEISNNKFFTHYCIIPKKSDDFISTDAARPERKDTDAWGCVLAQDAGGTFRIVGWHQIGADGAARYILWTRLPQ